MSETDPAPLKESRQRETLLFQDKGVPSQQNEMWRDFKWEKILQNTYSLQQQADDYRPVETFFNCAIHNIASYMFTFLNGWYVHSGTPLTSFPNGITIGSLRMAKERSLPLLEPYLSDMEKTVQTGIHHLNGALWQDGFFVYIPDNIHCDKPVQMANVVKTDRNLFINTRNLIIVGKNASLKLIHCDDTLESKNTLINGITEIIVDENAQFDYFKLENKENNSVLLNEVNIYQYKRSLVTTNTNTFNGGVVHNTIRSSMMQPFASVHFNGLYMADKDQQISNCLHVNHFAEDCTSRQMYHGIVDDAASAHFTGHIFVAPDAQKTKAYQLNRNLLLTDDATVITKPFLEIYADDVKCSHGATVGQLEESAVFYLRSRGICEKNARTLLMHAFAKEVLAEISIDSLLNYLEDMVQKRLTGEIVSCTQCTPNCDKKTVHFAIDLPEL
jgi:Fe-S cluster assembly protein SufD